MLIKTAGEAMAAKLTSYNRDHLPKGCYWDPSLKTQATLSKLKPHNDKTESVFGLNDWLNRILPNMAQATRSVMIEFSVNKTMQWLKDQAQEQKIALIAIARNKRREVEEHRKKEAEVLLERKVQIHTDAVKQGEKKKEKREALIQDLKQISLISTVEEFHLRKRALN